MEVTAGLNSNKELVEGALEDALEEHVLGERLVHDKGNTPKVIHILGASGSGTTTLGNALNKQYGYIQFDSDDYFWMPTNPPYTTKREPAERLALLTKDVETVERCVISGSLCGWGDGLIPKFELVILIDTPTQVRLKRLGEREARNFGTRILPGGDMYEDHVKFIEWAGKYDTAGLEQRSIVFHEEWLKKINCPVVVVDGTKPTETILEQLGFLPLKTLDIDVT